MLEKEQQAIETYIASLKQLHELNILKSKHDFTGQIGEWIVEHIFEGERAKSSIQKGWDVDVNGYHIQVKTHAKSDINQNRWSIVDKNVIDKIDELIIIEFTSFYKIISFYKVPWSIALLHIKERNIDKPRYELSWSSVEEYRVNLDDLPNQQLLSIFR